MFAFKDALLEYFKINGETECSEEECKRLQELVEKGEQLPSQFRKSVERSGVFFKKIDTGYSLEDLQNMLLLDYAKNLKTIKNCIVYFTVISVIFLAISVIYGISLAA